MELIKALSDSQIEGIRDKTEQMLEGTGLQVTHPRLLALCAGAGLQMDATRGRVRLPRSVLRELLAESPSSFTIGSAGGARHALGGDEQQALAIVTDPLDHRLRDPAAAAPPVGRHPAAHCDSAATADNHRYQPDGLSGYRRRRSAFELPLLQPALSGARRQAVAGIDAAERRIGMERV